MPHTLWSGDTLVGDADLAVGGAGDRILAGPLRLTGAGHALLPRLLAPNEPLAAIGPMLAREVRDTPADPATRAAAVAAALRTSPEGERLRAALETAEALRLEVRDADGTALTAAFVLVRDDAATWTADIPAEERDAAIAIFEREGVPRYLLSVVLR